MNELTLVANNSKAFSRELVVIPSYMAKGLEYDATIVYTEKDNQFTYKEIQHLPAEHVTNRAYRVEAGHRSIRETRHPVPPQRRGGRHCQ